MPAMSPVCLKICAETRCQEHGGPVADRMRGLAPGPRSPGVSRGRRGSSAVIRRLPALLAVLCLAAAIAVSVPSASGSSDREPFPRCCGPVTAIPPDPARQCRGRPATRRRSHDAMGWRLALDAQGGTGYLRTGSRPTFRCDRSAGARPCPVLAGHRGRRRRPPRPGEQTDPGGARSYFNRLNRFWPTAAIYLIVPFEVSAPDIAEPAPWWHALYARFAAARPNTFVVDPTAGQWFATDGTQLAYKMPGTNAHPNQAGHDLSAAKFLSILMPRQEPTGTPTSGNLHLRSDHPGLD